MVKYMIHQSKLSPLTFSKGHGIWKVEILPNQCIYAAQHFRPNGPPPLTLQPWLKRAFEMFPGKNHKIMKCFYLHHSFPWLANLPLLISQTLHGHPWAAEHQWLLALPIFCFWTLLAHHLLCTSLRLDHFHIANLGFNPEAELNPLVYQSSKLKPMLQRKIL